MTLLVHIFGDGPVCHGSDETSACGLDGPLEIDFLVSGICITVKPEQMI